MSLFFSPHATRCISGKSGKKHFCDVSAFPYLVFQAHILVQVLVSSLVG